MDNNKMKMAIETIKSYDDNNKKVFGTFWGHLKYKKVTEDDVLRLAEELEGQIAAYESYLVDDAVIRYYSYIDVKATLEEMNISIDEMCEYLETDEIVLDAVFQQRFGIAAEYSYTLQNNVLIN